MKNDSSVACETYYGNGTKEFGPSWKAFRWFRVRWGVLFWVVSGFLQVGSVSQAATLTWDIISGNGSGITGGSGTWTDGLGNWNTGSGDTIWNSATPDSAIFGGTAGTVTLGGAVTVGNMVFNSVYTLAGGGNTLTLLDSTITANTTATISAALGGSTGLSKDGSGFLTLSGTNTYTGTTTISSGVLNVTTLANGGSNSNIGAASNDAANLVLNGGTLKYSPGALSAVNTDRLFSVGASGGTLDASGGFNINFTNTGSMGFNGQSGARTLTLTGNNANDNTLAAVIGDNGGATSVNKTGNGVWVLSGANTYTGATTVTNSIALKVSSLANGGVASSIGASSSAASNLVLNGGTFTYTGGTVSTDRLFSLGTSGITLNVFGTGGVTFTNTGNMGFNGQTGARTLTLANSNGGASTIAAVIGDNGGATSVTHTLVSSTWVLTGANTYTGATTINGGVLSVTSLADGGSASGIGAASSAATNLVLNGGKLLYTGAGSSTDRLFSVGSSGGTLDSSGTGAVNFTNTGSMGFNSQTGARTLTLTGTNTGANTLATAIGDNSGATAVAKTGAGTWVLTGTNSYTGATTISAGVLQVGNGGTSGTLGSGAVTDNGNLTFNRSDNLTVANAIIGSGSVSQIGTGTTTLSGTNSYLGVTTISGGALSVATLANGNNASNIGASSNAATNLVLNGGALQYTGGAVNTDRLFSVGTSGGTLDASGTGAVAFTNSGSMGFNSQSGARTLTLTGSNSANNIMAAVIGDSGGATALTKTGAGTWTLSGSSSYTGVTTINGGVLNVITLANGGSNSSLGASSNAATNLVLNGGTLKYSSAVGSAVSTDRLFSVGTSGGTIDASGGFNINFTNTGSMGFNGQSGARTLTLTGINANDNTLAAVIGDNGGATSVTKAGNGVWVLSGANTYTGVTTVSGTSVLKVSSLADGGVASNIGASSNAASNLVLNGGTLQYNNATTTSTDRLFSVGAAGGTISLPVAATLNFTNTGSIGFNGETGARTLNFAFSNSTFGGIISLASSIGDNGGATSVVKSNTFGTLRLTSDNNTYTGTTTINGGAVAIGNLGGSTGSIGTGGIIINSGGTLVLSRSGSVNLAQTISGAGGVTSNGNTMLTLSGTNTYTGVTRIISNGGVVTVSDLGNGGVASSIGASSSAAGNLSITNLGTLRYVGTGASTDRLFEVPTGTANPVATIESSGSGALVFTNTGAMGFGSSTGARTLVLGGTNTQNNTMNPSIGDNSGATALTKAGTGTWVLAGANTYSGVTTISGGVLSVGNGGTSGTLGSGAVINNGNLTFNRSDSITVANTISGSGSVTQAGVGTTTLSGANSYTGATVITAGVLNVTSLANGGSNSSLGASSNVATNLVLNGGTLRYTGSSAASSDRLFSVGTSGGTLDSSGVVLSFTNTGSMGFNGQSGARTLTLTGTNGAGNVLAAVIGDNGGATSLIKSGTGTWMLTGNNTYTGLTTISGGTLVLGNFGSTGSISGDIVDNGILMLNNTAGLTLSQTISGTGGVTVNAGSHTLSGTNTYTGVTSIAGGLTLSVATLADGGVASNLGAASNSATNIVLNNGILKYTGAGSSTDRLFGIGTLGGTLNASGTGAVNFTNTGSMGFNSLTGTRTLTLTGTNTGNNILAAVIGDNGGATSLIKSGTGTWVLTGNNTYTGTTTISGGTLALGNGGNTGSISGNIVDNGTLLLNNTAGLSLSQTISGTGGVTVTGGSSTLSGTNTYSGVTTIMGGVSLTVTTLANGGVASNLGAASSLASNIILNNGYLRYAGAGSSTDRLFSVGLAGGGLVSSGTGAVNFTNTGSIGYNSQTGIRNFTLSGTNTGANTLAASIGDNGGATILYKDGAGTWVLTGNNGFSGGTTISDGLLQVGNGGIGGALGSGAVINNANLTFNRSDAITVSNAISGTGTMTLAGTGTVTLSGVNSYTGGTVINAGVVKITSIANGGSNSNMGASSSAASNLVLNGGTLQYTGAAASTDRLFSVGTSGGSLDASGTGAVNFTNTGSMGFNSQTGARTLTLKGTNAGNNTLAAVIGDNSGNATSVIKSGGGNWLLTGLSTYTGTTTITNGKLIVTNLANGGSASSIGASSNDAANLVLNGAALQYTGAAVSTDRLFSIGTTGGQLDASGTGALNFTNTGSMGFNGQSGIRTVSLIGSNAGLLAAAIGDNGGATTVLMVATGSWTLSGASTYTGSTRIFGGVLIVSTLADGGATSSIGASSNAAANLWIDGGGLRYVGGATSTDRLFNLGVFSNTLDASGTGAVNFTNTGSMGFSGTGTRTLILGGTNTGSNTLAAVIGDNGGATTLSKSGTGTWVITGTNTYTGSTNVNAGTLQVGNGGTSGNLGTGAVNLSTSLVFNRSDAVTIGNNISGFGTFTQAGTGTTTFTGTNKTYSGTTFVNAGKLQAGGVNTLSSGSNVTVASGAVLEINGFNNTIGSLAGSGTVQNGTATAATLNVSGSTSSTFSGLIQDGGSASLNFNKTGAVGTLTLTGSNTYTGGTVVSGGVLSISTLANGGMASGIGASTNAASNLVLDGATLSYTGAATSTDRLFSVSTSGGTLDASGTGAVNFTNTGSIGFNSQTGARNFTLSGTNTGANTFATVIGNNGGSTSLIKSGSGTWVLTGANSYTGTTAFNGGVLQVGNGGTVGNLGSGLVSGFGSLVFNRSDSVTVANAISGSGSLTQSGAGTIILTGTNTYGNTTISAGTLQVGNGGTSGSLGSGSTTNNASLIINRSDAVTLAGTISGTGTFTQAGAGTTTLSGSSSSYNGATFVNAGKLQAGVANAFSSVSAVTLASGAVLEINGFTNTIGGLTGSGTVQNGAATAATLNVGGTASTSFNGLIQNGGSASLAFTKSGSGTLTLIGGNTYTGSTTITAGVLGFNTLANGGTASGIGSSSNVATNLILAGGTLKYTGAAGSTDRLFSVGVSGGTLDASGTGAVNFTNTGSMGFNSQSGARTLTLTGINGGGNTIAAVIGNNSGATSLAKSGTGQWMLTGVNSYTGPTTITGGQLVVSSLANGGSASNIGASTSAAANLVLNGGVLQYAGAAVSTDRLFSVGTSGGTLDSSGSGAVNFTNTGSMGFNGQTGARTLTLNGSNTGNNTLAALIGDNGGATSLLKLASSTWVLTGANTYTGGTRIDLGMLVVSSLANGGVASNIGASSNAASNLVLGLATLKYIGGAASTDRLFSAGTGGGTLDASGTGALNFTNTGSMGFNGESGTRVLFLQGSNTGNNTIAAIIGDNGGATSIYKNGTGLWVLSGADTYTGMTLINSGTLSVAQLANGGAASNLGASTNAATNLVLNGGTLKYTGAATSTDRLFSVGASGGTLDASGAGAVNFVNTGAMGFNSQSGARTLNLTGTNTGGNTLAAVISDNGGATSLTKSGAGTWVLTGANTYTGSTTISAGVLSVASIANGGSSSNLGASTNDATNLVLNGGVLQYTGAAASTDRLFSVGTSGGTLDASGTGALNFTNTGSMGFNSQSGTRTLTLTGTNTGNNTLAAVIGDNGGATSLVKSGTGTWVLTGTNTYTGTTTISGGVLQVGSGSTTGSLGSGAVINNGSLVVNRSNAITLANTISGSGSFTQAGSGTTTLSGTNSYTGATTINAGVLNVTVLANGGSSSNIGAATSAAENLVINGGTLQYSGAADVSTDRLFSVGIGSAVIDVTGSGALNFTNTGSMGFNGESGDRNLLLTGTNSGVNTIAAAIGDFGGATSVSIDGSATWLLTGANTYTGATTVSSGVLQIGGSNLDSAIILGAHATLELNGLNARIGSLAGSGTVQNNSTTAAALTTGGNNTSTTFSGVIQDGGAGGLSIVKAGSGTFTLTGTNTYTGTTTISAGVLQVGSGGTTGTLGSGAVTNNASLIINRSDALTIANGISGSGSFTQAGSGTTTLTGESSYSGSTTINAGVLSVAVLANGGSNSNLGASTNAATSLVLNGGTLRYTGADVSTDRLFSVGTNGGTLDASGTGAVNFTNTGSMDFNSQSGIRTLTLTGTNTGDNTLAAVIGDNGGATALTKSGMGTWVLTGNNNNSGITMISAGVLQIGAGGTTGSLGSGAVTDNGSLIINRSDAITIANAISGSGSFTQAGSGTTTLTGDNGYTGSTTINAGVLSVAVLADGGSNSHLGASTNEATNLVLNGGSLQYTGADVSTDRLFSVGTNDGTMDASGTGAVNFTNSGSMGFNGQSGARTLTLTGTNTGGNTLAAVIGDNGGATAVTKFGTGTWVLTGANSYTGVTSISAGELQVGAGGTTGALGTGAVINNASLMINRSDALTIANDISGSGVFTQAGSGVTTLTGDNSYSGSTTINAGVLSVAVLADGGVSSNVGASTNAASNLVLNGGALQYTGGDTSTDRLFSVGSSGGTLDASGTGAVNFTNTGSMGFNSQSGMRTLTLTGTNTGINTLAAVIGDNGDATTLTKSGSGTWVLSGANTHTGATTISAGVLQIGDGGTTGSLSASSALINNGTLAFNRTDAVTQGTDFASVISGSGGVTQAGSGMLKLNGDNTYAGATNVRAGALEVTRNNALGTGVAGTTVSSGATLLLSNVNYSTSEALTLNGSGAGGGGALRNSGTSTYTGAITATTNASINAGGGILNLTGGLVKDGTVLTITGGGTVYVNGTGISGASASSDLVVDGTTLVVNANSDYNGPTTVQNSAALIANAAVTTTRLDLSSDSLLAGTGAITTAANQSMFINGTFSIGDPGVAATATTFALTTSGSGAVVMGADSVIRLDLFSGAGLGNNLSNAAAADSINLHGKLDATAGGTVVIDNPNGMTNFRGGDQWQLVHLNSGDANAGSFAASLALNDSSLHLASGFTSYLDQSNGVFSIIDTNGGLALAAVEVQALVSGGNTVTSDLNGHLFNLRSGGGEEGDDSDSITAALDDGVIVGEGDGDPKKASPIAKRVARSRQWEVFATVNYGNVKLNPIRTQSGVQIDSWASGVGAERHFSRGLTLGFAASFLQSSQGYTSNAGSLHLEGPALSAYVSYVRGGFWNSLLYSFGTYQMDSIRNTGVSFPTAFGSTRTYTHSVQYNTGWNMRFQNDTLVTGPFAGVDYLHGSVDAYNETGGGLAALHYSAQSYQSLVSRVGWSASKQIKAGFGTITPQVRLSYERQNIKSNNGTSVSLINVPFSSTGGGQAPGQDYLVAGLGVNLAFNDRFSLMLSYQGQFFRHDLQAHFGSIRFSYQY
jgi:fibronectin-binding autotransporter adhesin